MKKTLFISILLLVVFFISGCSKVQYDFVMFEDGTIAETFKVELDEDVITSEHYNVQTLKTKIRNDCQNIITQRQNNYQHAYTVMPEVITNDNIKNYFEDGIETNITWENNVFICQVLYADFYLYCFFNNKLDEYTTNGFESEITEKKIFYNKTTYVKANFYKQSTLREQLFNSYKLNYPAFDENDVSYVYRYGVHSSRWHSDANYVDYDGNNYLHTWVLSADELDDNFTLYKIEANYGPWFALGMSIGFVFASTMIFISLIKNMINRNKLKNNK